MSWLDLPRVPELEVMDSADVVEAYASAAAQAHLDRIDDSLVEHAMRLISGRRRGRGLDIGTGPGQIPIKLAQRLPEWEWVGVDRSPGMIARALASIESRAGASGVDIGKRLLFLVADANRLNFPDASFDLVMCNSVLHHLADPQRVLSEVARLAKPTGGVLIRDLRRPSRLAFPFHVRWYGRHYSGPMYKLYCDSVRAAYTLAEVHEILQRSPLVRHSPDLPGATPRVFVHEKTHLGIERSLTH